MTDFWFAYQLFVNVSFTLEGNVITNFQANKIMNYLNLYVQYKLAWKD
jgi:hypothetical protein